MTDEPGRGGADAPTPGETALFMPSRQLPAWMAEREVSFDNPRW